MNQDYSYINRTYGLSIKRGTLVEYTERTPPRRGVVTSADGQYINIRFDGDPKAAGPFHPTWKLRYLDEDHSVMTNPDHRQEAGEVLGELPEAIRVPLHSLIADIEYLFGRVAVDGSRAPSMANNALNRLRQIEAAIRAASPPAPTGVRDDAGTLLRGGVTDEMVERAARAMADGQLWEGAYDNMDRSEWGGSSEEKKVWQRHARLGLEAALSKETQHD